MAWNEAVVTNDGLELLAKCILGNSIEITSAAGGENTSPTVSLLAMKEIKAPTHELHVAKVEQKKNGVTVNVRVQNDGVLQGYFLRQIGIFARLSGSDETSVLLAVIQDKDGEEVPTEEENPEYLLEYDFVIPVDNGEIITVKITPNTFATLDDFSEMNEHIKNRSNPHVVTKAQVGLGNVPNVTTNDQTPTYTAAGTLAELTSGEKMSAAFGKIAKTVKEFISHLADNVRHVTADERTAWNGKAAGTHTHSAATQSAAGFMSAGDKAKLDGISAGANAYTHPTTSGNKHIPSGGSSGQILRWSADGTAAWGADNDTTYGAATQSAAGLMSAADKKKLDGIAAGANAYTHPTYTARTGVPTANQTPAFGGTFSVSQIASDASGHVTNATERTVKIPNTTATQSAVGLMSAADKKKIDDILTSSGAKALVSQGNVTLTKGSTESVTISHEVSVLICLKYSTMDACVLVLGSGHTSEGMPESGPKVTLTNKGSGAEVAFTAGSSTTSSAGTVYYYAFG